MAFEQLEALRWADYLKSTGTIIVNEQRIDPMPVITGKAKYPENIIPKLKTNIKKTISIDALKIAKECGNIKTVNLVLLGILAKSVAINKQVWLGAIRETIPAKLLDVNLKAFEAGFNY